MTETRQLTVRGRYDNIPTITHFVAEAAAAAGLAESGIFHCQMAVDEACTNIIEHAYGGEDGGDIQIGITLAPGVCQIEVVDFGEPFDPDSVPRPQLGARIEDIKPGGIGLHLMRQMMDEVHFEFGEGANRLVMVKRQEPVPQRQVNDAVASYEASPGAWVIAPLGRVDSLAAPAFERALFEVLDTGAAWLVVDLSDSSYISSRGLKALISAWRAARDAQGDVILCGMKPSVFQIFETVGFTQIFRIVDSAEEALNYVSEHRS